jgi:anti-sigma-K factor RskA
MKDRHVRSILESAPFEHLSAGELEIVRAHASRCFECARALEAARVASTLLRERAASKFEPSPFFQTRVLAALRERSAADEVPGLLRLWRAAGALASSMAAAVVLLAALTFVQAPSGTDEAAASVPDPYSTEAVLAQDETNDSDLDVLAFIYDSDESAGGFDGQEH